MDAGTGAAEGESLDDAVVYRVTGRVKTNIRDRIVLESRLRPPYYITELNLDYCSAPKVQGLTDMFYNLQILTLRGVGLVDLSTFPRLVGLHRLELAENKISSGLGIFVESCPNLRMLTLSDNLIATLDDLKPLQPLTLNSLTYMDFQRNPIAGLTTYRKSILDFFTELLYLDEMDRQGKMFWDSDSSSSESSELEDESESEAEESVASFPDADAAKALSPVFRVPRAVAVVCGSGLGNALSSLPISAFPQPTRDVPEKRKHSEFTNVNSPAVVVVKLTEKSGASEDATGLQLSKNLLDKPRNLAVVVLENAFIGMEEGAVVKELGILPVVNSGCTVKQGIKVATLGISDGKKFEKSEDIATVAIEVLKAVKNCIQLAKPDDPTPTSADASSIVPSEPPCKVSTVATASVYCSSVSNSVLHTPFSRPQLMLKRLQVDRGPIQKSNSPKPSTSTAVVTRSKSNSGASAEAQAGSVGKAVTAAQKRYTPPVEQLDRAHNTRTRSNTKEGGFKR